MNARRMVAGAAGVGAAVLCLVLAGCASSSSPVPSGAIPYKPGQAQRPVIAVMDLENQAGAFGQWNLGSGMADMLVTRLMQTRKVVVLERQYLRDIMQELSLQQGGAFRPEGRVPSGRLKNAKYLIRGSITDFAEVLGARTHLGLSPYKLFGGGRLAIVALHLRVYDVESGEILSSIKAEGSASAVETGAAGRYQNLQFGGSAFKRTPLGQATEQALARATAKLLQALPLDYWQPLVAECVGQTIIVNGGANVGLQPGNEFIVRDHPQRVTDPATGNVIATLVGQQQGRIRIEKVHPLAATAVLVEGSAARGQVLEPAKP